MLKIVKNNAISKNFATYLLVAVIAVILLNLRVLTMNLQLGSVVGALLGLVSCAAAIYYAVKGFGKNAVQYYRAFLLLAFLTYQLAACTVGANANGAVAAVMVCAQCLVSACALTLMLSRDLGKKTSMILCWTIFGVTGLIFAGSVAAFALDLLDNTAAGMVVFSRTASNFFVAQVIQAMTMAKYLDKTARGTK